jgi:hypothetical protein
MPEVEMCTPNTIGEINVIQEEKDRINDKLREKESLLRRYKYLGDVILFTEWKEVRGLNG